MRASPAEAQVLTHTEDLERLRPAWQELWTADPRATPFHAPQWLLPWWKHVGRGRLLAFALRDAARRLDGFAPLYVHTDARGLRQLFPLGIATTDYLGVLMRPGCEDDVLQGLHRALERHAGEWDRLHIPQLRSGDPLLQLPGAAIAPGEPHPVLSLVPMPAIPKSTLANLRTCRNRAARKGTLACETATRAELPAYLSALSRLHGLRWNARGEAGVLADQAVLRAHEEAAPLLQDAGLLRLCGLRLDGELVAVLYALADRRRWYYYLGGFDPAHADVSPGSLLLAHAIEQAAEEGAESFDFLRGAEAYKYRWGAFDQAIFTLRVDGIR